VSYELVCSGSGIRNIYAFLRESGRYEEPAWLAQRLRNEPDPTIVIREAAQDSARPSEICREAMRMFVSILGAETGNLALKFLPTGGIYIGGGLPPRILPMLDDVTFIEAYLAKGRLSPVIGRMPVHVILNTDVGLIGAAGYGMGIMQNP
jgi:glucokinase